MLGVFDSGLGGLSVVKSILDVSPGQEIIYYGDTARVPYGSKSPKTIIRYAKEDCEKLIAAGADKIVIACHSASSVAGDRIRSFYKRQDIMVWDVASTSFDDIVSQTKGRIGLIGTRATINAGFHKKSLLRLNGDLVVISQACPLLVPLVEEGFSAQSETTTILEKYLRPLIDQKIDTLILGCTHYPLVMRQIKQILPAHIKIIDPAISLARKLPQPKNIYDDRPVKAHPKDHIKLFFSDDSPIIPRMIEKIFGSKMPYDIC